LDEFYCYIRKNILKNKQAYILHNLLNDIKAISTENDLQESVIGFTSVLRTKLEVTFEDQLGYWPSGIYVIVYSLHANPCLYFVSALQWYGLRSAGMTRAYANMIMQKMENRNKVTRP